MLLRAHGIMQHRRRINQAPVGLGVFIYYYIVNCCTAELVTISKYCKINSSRNVINLGNYNHNASTFKSTMMKSAFGSCWVPSFYQGSLFSNVSQNLGCSLRMNLFIDNICSHTKFWFSLDFIWLELRRVALGFRDCLDFCLSFFLLVLIATGSHFF